MNFTDEVLDFANEIFGYVMTELTENRDEWYYRFNALSNDERRAFFKSISDAFNDTTEN